jgi:hypothetical protein
MKYPSTSFATAIRIAPSGAGMRAFATGWPGSAGIDRGVLHLT